MNRSFVAADVRRLKLFGLREIRASLRRLLRFRDSMREDLLGRILSPPGEGRGQGEGRPRRFKGARRAKSPGRSLPIGWGEGGRRPGEGRLVTFGLIINSLSSAQFCSSGRVLLLPLRPTARFFQPPTRGRKPPPWRMFPASASRCRECRSACRAFPSQP